MGLRREIPIAIKECNITGHPGRLVSDGSSTALYTWRRPTPWAGTSRTPTGISKEEVKAAIPCGNRRSTWTPRPPGGDRNFRELFHHPELKKPQGGGAWKLLRTEKRDALIPGLLAPIMDTGRVRNPRRGGPWADQSRTPRRA